MNTRILFFIVSILTAATVSAETYDAVLDWAKRIELGPLVSGTVAEVNADVGDFAKQGTTLLRIDSKPYETVVKMRESELASAAATRDNAKDELDRQQELFDIGSLSTVELDKAVFDFTQAETAYLRAKETLELAQLDISHTILKAPFDAWVVEQYTSTGQKVNAAMNIPVLFVVALTNEYAANATIPNNAMQSLRMNDSAVVVIGEKRYQGKVVRSSVINTTESTISVNFTAIDESYLPGTPAKIEIE